MPKLKLQYFGHLMRRTDLLEKTLMLEGLKAGGERDKRVRWLNGHHQLDGHEFEQALGVGDGQGSLACRSGLQRVGRDWATKQRQLIPYFIHEKIETQKG